MNPTDKTWTQLQVHIIYGNSRCLDVSCPGLLTSAVAPRQVVVAAGEDEVDHAEEPGVIVLQLRPRVHSVAVAIRRIGVGVDVEETLHSLALPKQRNGWLSTANNKESGSDNDYPYIACYLTTSPGRTYRRIIKPTVYIFGLIPHRRTTISRISSTVHRHRH